ncbi:MAG TPA: C-5 sterol desaturase [Moraxellaceae bacterium]|nr:C-5 sterol desaturase [Moraxellaceae bacterium]
MLSPAVTSSSLLLLALAPVFFVCIGWEFWYWHRHGRDDIYSLPGVASDAALARLHQAADALVIWLFVTTAYAWAYKHGLNLSTAFRQSLTYPLSGMWVFWLPIAWVGFTPQQVILVVGLNLAYQFFVHAQAIPKLGMLEYVFNTPSIHRVHHAQNPQYIDRNYAGVLSIWGRLFGTLVEEQEPCRFGITKPIPMHNPLTLTFHEWRDMFRDAWREKDLRYLWMPPDWVAEKK